MKSFLKLMGDLQPGTNIVDLGGQPHIWDFVSIPLRITIINLPGVASINHHSVHKISYIEGDACDLNMFKDDEFEVSFSNSVIEHVGDDNKILSFSNEAQRVGRKIWVQTPSKYFPLEPHTGMPFWWYYPDFIKNFLMNRWARKLPAWTEMVKGTRYITRKHLEQVFPDCNIRTERFFGLPKSYIVYSKSDTA